MLRMPAAVERCVAGGGWCACAQCACKKCEGDKRYSGRRSGGNGGAAATGHSTTATTHTYLYHTTPPVLYRYFITIPPARPRHRLAIGHPVHIRAMEC